MLVHSKPKSLGTEVLWVMHPKTRCFLFKKHLLLMLIGLSLIFQTKLEENKNGTINLKLIARGPDARIVKAFMYV